MIKVIFLIFSFISLYSSEAFISSEYLKNSLDDKNLVLIDVSDKYKQGHIKGAIGFNVKYLINKEKSYNALKSQKRVKEIFGNIGISNDSSVIIYGRNSFEDLKRASFLAFVLNLSGLDDVKILDGGYMSWVFSYDDLIVKESTVLNSVDFTLKTRNIIADAKIFKAANKRNLIIDARDTGWYENAHIVGAKSSPFSEKFLFDYTIKPIEKLQAFYFNKLDIGVGGIIVYSDDIFTSSVEWFIISRVMGFRSTKIYYNSFSEYKDLDLEISSYK